MPDQLATWQQIREQVPWRDVVPDLQTPIPAVRDGFTAHATIGADRRRQILLLDAYADTRRAATTGAGLTPDLTTRWNGMLRGRPAAGFRRGPAFAKNGRDRYGLPADTHQRYASCLSEAADQTVPVAARAARAYLDTAFFHPYDDGNARLSGLVLHFVLCVPASNSTRSARSSPRSAVPTTRKAQPTSPAWYTAPPSHQPALAPLRGL